MAKKRKAKKRKRLGPVLTVRSTMTPASASAIKSDCTLTVAGPYGHCLLGGWVGQVVRLDQVDPGPEDQHHVRVRVVTYQY